MIVIRFSEQLLSNGYHCKYFSYSKFKASGNCPPIFERMTSWQQDNYLRPTTSIQYCWDSDLVCLTSGLQQLHPTDCDLSVFQLLQHLPPGPLIRHPYASPSVRFHSLRMLHLTSWLGSCLQTGPQWKHLCIPHSFQQILLFIISAKENSSEPAQTHCKIPHISMICKKKQQ